MKKPKAFNVGDKVFAKVKGYPAWPAKIVAVNGRKYEVNFYGTGEKGLIKVEDLFYYLKHKEQFCKNLKRKDYIEAVEQIEAEIKETGTDGNTGNDDDGSQEEPQEKPEKTKGRKRKRSNSNTEGKKSAPSSNDSLATEDTENSLVDDSSINESDSKIILPAVSRSGRVIKTKRLSLQMDDEEKRGTKRRRSMPEGSQTASEGSKSPKMEIIKEDSASEVDKSSQENDEKIEEEEEKEKEGKEEKEKMEDDENKDKIEENDTKEDTTEVEKPVLDVKDPDSKQEDTEAVEVKVISSEYLNTVISYAEHVKSKAERYKSIQEEPRECFENEVVLATLPSGKVVGIKYGTNSSKHTSEYDRALSDEEEAKTLLSLKDLVEKGDCKPEDDPNMFIVNIEIPEDQDSKIMEMTRNKIKLLKIEASLVDYDGKIKSSLGLDKAEPKTALEYLDLMSELNITQVMLKKHPSIVNMVKHLKRYVGNAKSWKLTGNDLEEFQKEAKKIRVKAEEIIMKFKTLFSVPEDTSFWDVFNNAVEVFKEETKDLNENEVFALCAEPFSRQTFFDNHIVKLDIETPSNEEEKDNSQEDKDDSQEDKDKDKENCSNTPSTEQKDAQEQKNVEAS